MTHIEDKHGEEEHQGVIAAIGYFKFWVSYVFDLTMVKCTILKLILAQLPMKKIIKVKTNHN